MRILSLVNHRSDHFGRQPSGDIESTLFAGCRVLCLDEDLIVLAAVWATIPTLTGKPDYLTRKSSGGKERAVLSPQSEKEADADKSKKYCGGYFAREIGAV